MKKMVVLFLVTIVRAADDKIEKVTPESCQVVVVLPPAGGAEPSGELADDSMRARHDDADNEGCCLTNYCCACLCTMGVFCYWASGGFSARRVPRRTLLRSKAPGEEEVTSHNGGLGNGKGQESYV